MRGEIFDHGGEGSTWQRGLFALLIVIVVVGAAVLLVRMWLAARPNHTFGRFGGPTPPPHNPALAELDLRYARGEVTREEYLQRRADLLGHIGPGSAAPPGAPPPPV
jgi:putative membrane protein